MSDELLRDALRSSLERGLRRPQPNVVEVVRRGRRKKLAIVAAGVTTVATLAAGGGYVASGVLRDDGRVAPGGEEVTSPYGPRGCPHSKGGGHTNWTSPTVLVARGRVDGDPWVFCARTAIDDGPRRAEALCMNWQFRSPLGSGMDCAYEFRRNGSPVRLGQDHFSPVNGPDEGYFFGSVPAAAAAVELVTDDGRTFPGTVHESPEDLGVPFRFFTLFAEPYVEGDLVVRDADGAEIRRRRMEHGLSLLTVETAGEGTVTGFRTEQIIVYEGCRGTDRPCREPRPTWIDCGDDCEAALRDARITLRAEAADGWTFAGWSGACSGDGECELVVDRTLRVVATFEEEP